MSNEDEKPPVFNIADGKRLTPQEVAERAASPEAALRAVDRHIDHLRARFANDFVSGVSRLEEILGQWQELTAGPLFDVDRYAYAAGQEHAKTPETAVIITGDERELYLKLESYRKEWREIIRKMAKLRESSMEQIDLSIELLIEKKPGITPQRNFLELAKTILNEMPRLLPRDMHVNPIRRIGSMRFAII